MIKSFRGLLKDEGIDRIYLSTNTGRTGYRIIKFEVIPNNPGGQDPEAILNIFKRKPSSAVALIDFSDNDLVAAAYYSGGSTTTKTQDSVIIFDNDVFNQDIFITLNDDSDNESMNWYVELEQVMLDSNQATVVTLKDMRGRNTT